MLGTAGSLKTRLAGSDEQLDREVDAIAHDLAEHGPEDRGQLARRVGARRWGPGRFSAALRQALTEGRAKRLSHNRFGPAAR
jgi:hypothetical protein